MAADRPVPVQSTLRPTRSRSPARGCDPRAGLYRSDWAMTIVKQLRLLTAVLGVGTASAVIGTAVFGDAPGSRPVAPAAARIDPSVPAADSAARTTYSDTPTLTYPLATGDTVLARPHHP